MTEPNTRLSPRQDGEYPLIRELMRELGKDTPTAVLVGNALWEELTPRQREMVMLYYVQQNTMRDVAEKLGVNPSTVSRTLKSAREKLRRCLRYSRRSFLWEEE